MVLSKLKSWLCGSDESDDTKDSKDKNCCEPAASEKPVMPAPIGSPKTFSAGLLEREGVTKLRQPRHGYKATRNGIIRLIIPAGAKVAIPVTPTGMGLDRKLRASKVYVDKIVPVVGKGDRRGGSAALDNMLYNMAGQSFHDPTYTYEEGEFHEPDEFDDNPLHACSNGLHFFPRAAGARKWFKRNHPNHIAITDWEVTSAERKARV